VEAEIFQRRARVATGLRRLVWRNRAANPPSALVAAARQRGLPWTFTGYIDDIRPHVATARVFVIPLRVGSGTRIKAFEAMAMGRPVVSTTVGVEGLDVKTANTRL
jgi:glycosyltransferase involved in cell wall biosynthesis